jgi:hypothetical protein
MVETFANRLLLSIEPFFLKFREEEMFYAGGRALLARPACRPRARSHRFQVQSSTASREFRAGPETAFGQITPHKSASPAIPVAREYSNRARCPVRGDLRSQCPRVPHITGAHLRRGIGFETRMEMDALLKEPENLEVHGGRIRAGSPDLRQLRARDAQH